MTTPLENDDLEHVVPMVVRFAATVLDHSRVCVQSGDLTQLFTITTQ